VACRSSSKQSSEVCELEAEESLLALENADSRRVYSKVFVDGRKVRFLLDCGSTVNILPASMMATIGHKELRPPRATLRMFDRQELKTVGMLTATVKHPRTHTEFDAEFYVTEREDPSWA
jgi:hypothetical protein